MAQPNPGLMGQYAGFVTRAVALIIDIVIVIVSVLVISAAITLPLDFFLGINSQACAAGVDQSWWARQWPGLFGLLCAGINATLFAIALLTAPVYFIFLVTAGGQTIGKYIMGVRVVSLDGKPMNYAKSTIRWLGYFVSLLALGLGFAWVLVDDRRRGFQDMLAGTCVVYGWRAQQNEYMLERIRRLFGRRGPGSQQSMVDALTTKDTELATIAVSNFDELREIVRIVQDGISRGKFRVLGYQEYAKSRDGTLNRIDEDADEGPGLSSAEFTKLAGLTAVQLLQIKAGVPNDHFALVVLVTEEDADAVIKAVSRRTTAQVRRYDLDQPGIYNARRQSAVQLPPAVISEAISAPPASFSEAIQPAPDATRAQVADASRSGNGSSAQASAPMEPIQSLALYAARATNVPVEPATPPGARHSSAPALAEPPAPVEAHTTSTTVKDDGRRQDAAQVTAAMPDAQDAAWEARYPALVQLGEHLSELPDTKADAVNAAIAANVIPEMVTAPEDLTAIKGIGPVFEQRLYRAGIGTYWEVAMLDDGELQRLLTLSELQLASIDLDGIRTDARRLAIDSGSVGHLWEGQAPDDFEPIDGIGPVFEQRLYAAGIRTYAALANTTPEALAQIVRAPKPSQPEYRRWIDEARRLAGERSQA